MQNLIDPANFCQFNDMPHLVDVAMDDLRKVAAKMKQGLKQPAAVLAFKSFSVLANRVERDLTNGQRTPCRKGCSVCCRTLPPLYPVEMVALAREIKNATPDERSLLVERGKAAQDRIEDLELAYIGHPQYGDDPRLPEGLSDYMDAFGPSGGVCPFLTASGTCMFYTHRPLACRLWVIVDDEPCTPGGVRHRAIAYPAVARLHSVLRLTGIQPYTPYDAIWRACGRDK